MERRIEAQQSCLSDQHQDFGQVPSQVLYTWESRVWAMLRSASRWAVRCRVCCIRAASSSATRRLKKASSADFCWSAL